MKRLVLPSLVLALTLPAGMACVLFTLALQIPSLGLLGEPHRTSGTVVGINNFKESGTTYQSRQVQFTSENGQQISIDFYGCWPFDCFPDYSIGSNAPVIYPTNHPELAIADTLSGRL